MPREGGSRPAARASAAATSVPEAAASGSSRAIGVVWK
jgi:hypothetical protein